MVFSFIGLTLFFPIFLVVALLIKLDSKGPIFFKQIRAGQHGKLFSIYKFRSMARSTDKQGSRITSNSDSRISRFGRILRKYKIDELPQLINVLKGEMSLVGPRPEIPEYTAMFSEDYKHILQVRPGITDFASIEYRDEASLIKDNQNAERIYLSIILPKKIELYKKYVNEKSIGLDFVIILKTLQAILRK